MIEKLTVDDFLPWLGQPFPLNGQPAIVLTLAEVNALGPHASFAQGQRRGFSLIFHGPIQPVLSQAIYPILHTQLGRLEIFIVPIGPQDGQMQYEAIFN